MAHFFISLLTDFGYRDHYVGVMKGVIFRINPQVKIVDISHQVTPHNITEGAFLLYNVYSYFPPGTIFVAVVDPGVGSKRKPILVKTENFYFVGPDNGIFGLIYEEIKNFEVLELNNPRFFLSPVSATFQGRDIFAPVAAYLSSGVSPLEMGKAIKNFVRLPFTQPTFKKKEIQGKVIYIDGFGNLVTNIKAPDFIPSDKKQLKIKIGNKIISGLAKNYQEVEKGSLLALIGSSNFLEIAVSEGSAQKKLKGKVGDPVQVFLS
jgi:S-adenosylmethionine hydrolase